jgi:hypothetical protein
MSSQSPDATLHPSQQVKLKPLTLSISAECSSVTSLRRFCDLDRSPVDQLTLPIPYSLPPKRYQTVATGSEEVDIPWSNEFHPGLDSTKSVFPGKGAFYGLVQSDIWAERFL